MPIYNEFIMAVAMVAFHHDDISNVCFNATNKYTDSIPIMTDIMVLNE